jgi:hypothetical protein
MIAVALGDCFLMNVFVVVYGCFCCFVLWLFWWLLMVVVCILMLVV